MATYFPDEELRDFFEGLGEVWGKRPHVFRQPFSRPVVSERDYWGLLTAWAREVRGGRRFSHPRWIEEDLLPRESDGGVRGFCERVDAAYKGDWYLYQADGVQQWSQPIWQRAVELLRPLLAREGTLPPGGVMLDLFLGKYQRTPSGIHRDDGEVLAFVTLGPKRLWFWPKGSFADPWASGERTHFQTGLWHVEKHLERATLCEAEPGDVIYWPRDWYHVGGSPDHWSGMVTMTMWWQASAQRAVRFLVDSLVATAGEPARYAFDPHHVAATAKIVPAPLAAASGAARRSLEQGWDAVLAEAWARLATGYGFLLPPARQQAPVIPADRYTVRHPVAVVEIAGQPQVFACGHKVGVLAGAPPALAVRLEALAVGEELDLAATLAAAGAPEPAIDPLVAALHAVGAVAPA